jgi:hypothetical protein
VLDDHTGADIGIMHDGMLENEVMVLVDMFPDEGEKFPFGKVEFGVLSQGSGVDMASFSNVGRGGIGRHSGKRPGVNRVYPRDSARQCSKLSSGHESTNETSGAAAAVGRVRGSSSHELGFHEAGFSSSGVCLANGGHDVFRFETNVNAKVSHGEIKIARD